jgi:hypothetical protein
MAIQLPTPTDGYPDMTIRCAIEGVTYAFAWLWNERESTWYVSIADSEGDPIVSGVRVVLNADLIGRTTDSRLPDGKILVKDITGATDEPDRDTLGQNVLVVYVSTAEIEAAA